MVQLPFAGIVPPANLTLLLPTASAALAASVKVPLHVLPAVVFARVIAPGVVGKVSVNVAAVSAAELLFAITICSVDAPVAGKIGLAKNDFVTVGGANTVMSAVAAVPLKAAAGPVTVNPPIGMVLTLRPTLMPVIVAVTVHEPLAGIVPPLIETVEPLAVFVPTQVPPGIDAARPDGSVSVKAVPVIAVAVGLINVMVSVEAPFSATVCAVNALLMLGRATFNVALVPTALLPMLELTAPAAIVLV